MKRLFISLCILFSLFFIPHSAYAAITGGPTSSGWGACLENDVPTLRCIPIVFQNLINWALAFSGVAAVVFIIISGVQMIGSGGDPKQIDKARKTLTFAIIGLVIILSSFFIINILSQTTGVRCITSFGFECK